VQITFKKLFFWPRLKKRCKHLLSKGKKKEKENKKAREMEMSNWK